MKLHAAPQAGSPLWSDKLRGILAKANKIGKDENGCPVKAGRKPNRKMVFSLFCQWHVWPARARYGLKLQNVVESF
jgi:hypothetical protein